jgi:hypothetical protein
MNAIRWLRDEWQVLRSSYRRPCYVVIVIAALVLISDFWLRVFVARDPGLRGFTPPAAQTIARAETTEQIRQQLDLWLPTKPKEPEVVERQISLQGVFGSSTEIAAVLALSPPTGTPVERVRATKGQVVEGWTVESITRREVILKKGEEGRELLLFRPRTE